MSVSRTNPAQSRAAAPIARARLHEKVVGPRGFEPLAFGFVVRRSVHPSYRRIKHLRDVQRVLPCFGLTLG